MLAAVNHTATALVGCAGWSVPRDVAGCFAAQGSQLQRYSSVFGAVEINSSFYRPHQASTYARWAASVPDAFRFSVKLPRLISHQLRLGDVDEPLARFAGEAGALGNKLGCVLVQLPPSGLFNATAADRFFTRMRRAFSCMLACEARHASWFSPDATALLQTHAITRVQADPPKGQTAAFVATTPTRYLRLHGSPKVYYSSYPDEVLADLAAQLAHARHPVWLIFDNTAAGAAQRNALMLRSDACADLAQMAHVSV